MTLRPPRSFTTQPPSKSGESELEYELLAEQAATLGQLGKDLERQLQVLRSFDPENREAGSRQAVVDGTAQALWYFVVQRELIGFRDSISIRAIYDVPAEVWNQMGVLRKAADPKE